MPRLHSRGSLQSPALAPRSWKWILQIGGLQGPWPDVDEKKGLNLQPPEFCAPKGPITTRCSEG